MNMTHRETDSHRHTHIFLILLSTLVGAAVTLVVLYGSGPARVMQTVNAQADAEELESAFIKVAAESKPAVVNITARTVARHPRMPQGMPQVPDEWRRFFEDPFFRPFGREGEGDEEGGEEAPAPPMPDGERYGQSMGSGWIYSEDGYIVTNSHVIKGAMDIRVNLYDLENDDKDYEAKVIGNDPRTELALLKIDAGRKLPALKVGDSKGLKVGSWVMAVGSPFDLEQTVTVGVISAKGRMINPPEARFQLGDIIQTDASINPGNSGGPLVNLKGEVIGVNVAILANGLMPANVGIGFAIPAEVVEQVVPVLEEEGTFVRGWLGITLGRLNENMREHYEVPDGGVLVEEIRDDGPAKDSDLQAEDVIVSIDGEPVRDTYSLQKAVGNRRPGTELTLGIVRAGKKTEVKLALGETPAEFAGLDEKTPEEEEPAAAEAELGLTLKEITAEIAEEKNLAEKAGVYVEEVKPGSEAAGKGIIPGDVILKINTTEVKTLADATGVMEAAATANDKFVIMRIARFTPNGDRLVITIDIDPQP